MATERAATAKALRAAAKALEEAAEDQELEERLEAAERVEAEDAEWARTASLPPPPPPAPPRDLTLPVLQCERCPALCESRSRIVNGRGNPNAPIMIIGEAPGREEDTSGKPFMGPTGKLLAKLLDEAGVEYGDIYTTNAIRCRPLNNRTPTAAEVAECKPYLLEEIKQVQPAVIVTVGAIALGSLVKGATIKGSLGQILTEPETGIPIVPTYHPSFLMRGNWALAPMVASHLRKAQEIARGDLTAEPLEQAQARWLTLDTVEKVRAFRDYVVEEDDVRVVCVDSETTGLDWMTSEVLCVSFGILNGEFRATRYGYAVPLLRRRNPEDPDNHTETKKDDWPLVPAWTAEEIPVIIGLLGDIFDCPKPKAIQNAIFDIKMLERSADDKAVSPDVATVFGWRIRNLRYDPMLLQRLIDENVPANETVMLSVYTDMPYYESAIKVESKNKRRTDLASDATLWTYAAGDGDGMARILEAVVRKAQREDVLWVHDHISIPMVRACWNMTRRGVPIDMDYFSRLCERYRVLVTEAEQKVMEAYGQGTFNLNKPADVQKALFQDLGLPPSGRKTPKAKECRDCTAEEQCDVHDATGKDALKDIKDIMRKTGEPHPILDAILHWKEVSKRKSVYVDGGKGDKGILRFIRPDDRVHPEFKPGRADTGRLSAVDPPIQTIPKEVYDEVLGETDQLRRVYVAPRGYTWMEADWNQGEVWVIAYESGDEQLLSLLREGRDVHTYVARTLCQLGFSRVFPASAMQGEDAELSDKDWTEKYKELRRKAKVFVFGLDYGMTAMGASERLGCSVEDAERLIDAFLSDVFPGLRAHFDRVREVMEATGVLVNTFGRKGHFGDFRFMRDFGRIGMKDWEAKFRKGVNMPIQSGLSDLHQLAQVELDLHDKVMRERLLIFLAVHDSIAGLVHGEPFSDREHIVQTAWMLKERMERMARETIIKPNGEPLGWAIPVEVSWGKSWGRLEWKLSADGNLWEPKEAA